ncbi:hypothetical protein SEA_FRANSOYER_31 [Microbacterium phage Fransoyer]|nr:hypothetical protein SEA_FRANSOYER_31 [Microbacterium phage Fransoyer]
MAITPVTAPLPAENADPWIAARNTLDNQLKSTANAAAALADQHEAQKGAASGIATLDAQGQLLTSQLPAIAVTDYLGASANQAAMLALSGQKGDWTIRTDRGTVWIITGANPAVIGGWTELAYPVSAVTSVNGKVGAVSLVPGDIGAATAADLNATHTLAMEAQSTANAAVPAADVAGLNDVGWARAVFIPNGGTAPVGTPAYTLVIEAGA